MIRAMTVDDADDVITSYYQLITECYPDTQVENNHLAYYRNVIQWVDNPTHTVLVSVDDDGFYRGFALIIKEDIGGVVKPYMNVECLYVEEEHRKSKATYELMHHIYELAGNNRLSIMCNANNDIMPILEKRFGFKKVFTQLLTTRSSDAIG